MDVKQFITENKLPEDIEPKLSEWHQTTLEAQKTELEKQYGGLATENAEKILTGAARKVEELTGIARDKGQKIADYLTMASENYLKGSKESLSKKERELEEKLKNGKIDDTLKQEYESLKEKVKAMQEKEAIYKEWEENDYKGKYQEKASQYEQLQKQLAFASVKPSFPESVNKYEADAKWGNFVKSIEDKYILAKDGEEWVGKDKENEFIVHKLKDLVSKNEDIQGLLKDRKLNGIGGETKKVKIEGIPFDLPENATTQDISKAIKDYLTTNKKLSPVSEEYAKEFAKLNIKVRETA